MNIVNLKMKDLDAKTDTALQIILFVFVAVSYISAEHAIEKLRLTMLSSLSNNNKICTSKWNRGMHKGNTTTICSVAFLCVPYFNICI